MAVRAGAVAEGQEEVGVVGDLGREGGVGEAQATTRMAVASIEAPAVVQDVAAERGGGEELHHLLYNLPGRLLPRATYWTRTSSSVSPFPTLHRPIFNLVEHRRRPTSATTTQTS